jgi:hypothetical protein
MTKQPSKPLKREPRTELRLKMELVPKPLWNQNLRTKLGKKGWSSLRNSVAQGVITSQEYERVIRHALQVNDCDMATWEQHGREALEAYKRRSKLSWTVDYGPLSRPF